MYLKLHLVLASLLFSFGAATAEFEVAGKLGAESRYFFKQGQLDEQLSHAQLSAFVEPELYWAWNDGDDSLTFKPFLRIDGQDDERSHSDIREFSYVHVSDDWEFRAGIRREFWGVTEFQHLVDVINQTDAVEDVDGEDKLGQQMLNLSMVNDFGVVDLYLLPGFRERTFSGEKGRLRTPIIVDTGNAKYESSAGKEHLDFAIRWSDSIGDFDIGSYWFHGTNREPVLMPSSQPLSEDELTRTPQTLQPYYQQMDQVGIDFQATKGDWLWKLESIYRHTDIESFTAVQAGFEYTLIGIFDSTVDVGLLMEYGWDSRGETSLTSRGANVQNDVFVGNRIAFNDVQSSEILLGYGRDMQHNSSSFLLEASRRFGDNVKISLDLRIYQSDEPFDPLYYVKKDDHLQLSIERYF